MLSKRVRAALRGYYAAAKTAGERDAPHHTALLMDWIDYTTWQQSAEARRVAAFNNLLGELASEADCDDSARELRKLRPGRGSK